MKAKNRIGIFDLLITDDQMIGTRAHIWITRSSEIDDNGGRLQTIAHEAASYEELRSIVEALKHDLDVLLERAKQHFD